MIPFIIAVFSFDTSTPQQNHHRVFKNIQTKMEERGIPAAAYRNSNG
jgi:hypothetical protein